MLHFDLWGQIDLRGFGRLAPPQSVIVDASLKPLESLLDHGQPVLAFGDEGHSVR
ncbi:MAG: hypothetical protein ACJAVR_002761 [Paracoccaceae bacterium]|jgi:hypothetical protein